MAPASWVIVGLRVEGRVVRDLELLKSALATPQASNGGGYLYTNVFEMAAAYLFHIVRDHLVVNGSKRTGLIAAAEVAVFLQEHSRSRRGSRS